MRNDPCPSGSGRKYKKCCFSSNEGFQRYTADEIESALQRMEDFVDQGGWQGDEMEAMDMFWDDLEEKPPSQFDPYDNIFFDRVLDLRDL